MPLETKDGRRVEVEFISNAYFVEQKRLIQCNIRDITERMEFESQRKRAHEKIEEQAALVDEARDAILVCDIEGRIGFWNKGAERLYGWMREEAVGHNVAALIYSDVEKFQDVNRLAISQGQWTGELHQVTKDQSEITVEARWTLIRDNDGSPNSLLAIRHRRYGEEEDRGPVHAVAAHGGVSVHWLVASRTT